jgi:hypothetical protein
MIHAKLALGKDLLSVLPAAEVNSSSVKINPPLLESALIKSAQLTVLPVVRTQNALVVNSHIFSNWKAQQQVRENAMISAVLARERGLLRTKMGS